jgi:2-amino-4-hydroxy-6-hydroxymethyldihydropteridine diphosphokinase
MSAAPAVVAYIALGSNLDNPEKHVRDALAQLDRLPRTRVIAGSSVYRSAPWGYADQPDFINAVAAIETALAPRELLRALLAVEERHGRKRSFANAPRTLDLDIALYGDLKIDEPGLKIPHPRLHERAFVLAPLAEIAPHAVILGGETAAQLLARCPSAELTKLPRP